MKSYQDAIEAANFTNPSDIKRSIAQLSQEDRTELIFSELKTLPPESLGRFVEAIGMAIQNRQSKI